MNDAKQITITHIPEISAIYFALLQCGYDYYTIERSQSHIDRIRNFIGVDDVPPFFSETKQSTCQVIRTGPVRRFWRPQHSTCCQTVHNFGNMMYFVAILCLPRIFPTVNEIKSYGVG